MLSKIKDIIPWPDAAARRDIAECILIKHGIPDCVGFVDGTNINLYQAPSQGFEASAYHSYKERYGFNLLAVVDPYKRFTYLHWGFSARSSDMRVQAATLLHLDPGRFFSKGEHIIGDKGFTCTENVIPMFRRMPRVETLSRRAVSDWLSLADAAVILQ